MQKWAIGTWDRYFGISVLPKVKIWYGYWITEWLHKFTEILVPKVGVGTFSIDILSLFESIFWRPWRPFWKPFDALKAFWFFEGLLKAFLWPYERLQSFFLSTEFTEYQNTELLNDYANYYWNTDTESWGKKYWNTEYWKKNFNT